VRLLLDMNVSPRWAGFLAASGHEAVHWSDIGPVTASDDTIMQWARANESVVLTHDLDFAAILAVTGGQKPSVIQIRADRLTPEAIGAHVLTVLHQFAHELAQGVLLTIEPGRARASLLPLLTQP
jgi:predicted nuclease of predicted toxin-antitoxin system